MVPLEFQVGPSPQVFPFPHMKASLCPTCLPCLTNQVGGPLRPAPKLLLSTLRQVSRAAKYTFWLLTLFLHDVQRERPLVVPMWQECHAADVEATMVHWRLGAEEASKDPKATLYYSKVWRFNPVHIGHSHDLLWAGVSWVSWAWATSAAGLGAQGGCISPEVLPYIHGWFERNQQ